jgi:hypothetical protein
MGTEGGLRLWLRLRRLTRLGARRTPQRVRNRLKLWLLCGVVVGVSPVICNIMIPLFSGQAGLDFNKALGDGELLISSTAIAGAAADELFFVNIQDERTQNAKITWGRLTLIFCLFCAFAYAGAHGALSGESSTISAASSSPAGVTGSRHSVTFSAAGSVCWCDNFGNRIDR